MCKGKNKYTDSRGSVLILTLWVLFFLGIIVVAVGGHVASNVRVATRIKSRVAAYCLARAGIEKTITDTMIDSNAWDSLNELWSAGEDLFHDVTLGAGSYSVYYTAVSQSGVAVTNYGMYDEERKININKASLPVLKATIGYLGQVDSMTAADIAAAIVDWRDVDDVVLTGGAENSYYAALSEPYKCRNSDFELLHELLLVKGMTPALFGKLRPYLTVFGTGKVNVNTAEPAVLLCVAEAGGGGDRAACGLLVDKIVRFRAAGNVFADPGIMGRLNTFVQTTPAEKAILARMTGELAIRSSCFGGISSGKTLGGEAEDRQIEFIFDRQRGVKLYWHEF